MECTEELTAEGRSLRVEMGEKKLTLEDYARAIKVIGNPQKLAIVCILYASEKLEELETERKRETEG